MNATPSHSTVPERVGPFGVGRSLDPRRMLVGVTYSLVFLAFVPIWQSGEVGGWAPVVFVAAALASLVRDAHGSVPRPWTAVVWTLALLATFAGLVAWSLRDGNWLLHALQFALLMTASRFFQRRWSLHYLQLQALSFILLLVAAIVNPGPAFAVCFLGYAVGTIWGLTLIHLVRELEIHQRSGPEHTPAPPPPRWWPFGRGRRAAQLFDDWPSAAPSDSVLQWRSRQLIGARFLIASSALALVVLFASALFFFLFPRLGMGFFFAQTRGTQNVVGFGTDAELGRFGALKTSAEVVMRLRFPGDPARIERPVRLRGLAFDDFVGTGWQRSDADTRTLPNEMGHSKPWNAEEVEPGRSRQYRIDIYLEPLGVSPRVLFAPPGVASVEILDARFDYLRGRRRRVAQTTGGDLTYVFHSEGKLTMTAGTGPTDTAIHYGVDVVEAIRETTDIADMQGSTGEPPERIARRWTGLPAALDPRITALAFKLAGGATTLYDQAINIENALRNGWQYSLAGDQDPDRPLEDFLFGKRRGHCEYFSTSMTLMMRALGHAARPVHGFAGGVLNPYGGYRMVRQADAHAWVEVFFPRVGWRTFDPTPPAGQLPPAEDSSFVALRQLADSAALVWYQWVVEYDLERQVEAMRSIYSVLQAMKSASGFKGLVFASSSAATDPTPDSSKKLPAVPWPWVLGALGGLALVAGVAVWRRRQPVPEFDRALARRTRRLERRLAKLGIPRQPHQTWRMVALRVIGQDGNAGRAVLDFAHAYDGARYGRQSTQREKVAARVAADGALVALQRWGQERRPATR